MRKSLFLGIFILFFAFLFPLALAQETNPFAASASPAPVKYELPYPGLLPDHPLYIFKSIRDLLLRALISHPIKKVEFDLLMADKRLNMAIFLFQKQKTELGVKTVAEGIDYLKIAKTHITEIPPSFNSQIPASKEKFERSLTAYLEILSQLSQTAVEPNISELNSQLESVKSISANFKK